MMSSATLSGFGSMSGLLAASYPMEEHDGYSMSPGSPSYCTLTSAGHHIPIYAALQAANDSPPHMAAQSSISTCPTQQLNYYTQANAMMMGGGQHHQFQQSADAIRTRSHSLESSTNQEERHRNGAEMSSSTTSSLTASHDEQEKDAEDEKNVSYHDNVSKWLNQQCGGLIKRKRKVTRGQRVAANHRERKRMGTFNEAFERLRDTIHSQGSSNRRKKMSRIQTLKSAIQYISDLTQLLNEDTEQQEQDTDDRVVHCW